MKTKREREQYKLALTFPSDILASAAMEQARLGKLSEAQASDIAGKYSEAAEIAHRVRTMAMERKT